MAGTPDAKIVNLRDSVETTITGDGAREAFGLPLLDLSEGTGQFDFRVVRIGPGGISSDHAHPWEQANYVLAGRGTVTLDGELHVIGEDDFVYVPPNVRHVFANTDDGDLVLLAARGPRA